MALSENETALLLEFQRARFIFDAFQGGTNHEQLRNDLLTTKEKLKIITDLVVAELVRKMSQEYLYITTPDSHSMDIERALEITQAENALYKLSFTYGDAIPNASDLKQ